MIHCRPLEAAWEQVENGRYLKRQLKIIISAIQTVMERTQPTAPPPIKVSRLFFHPNIQVILLLIDARLLLDITRAN